MRLRPEEPSTAGWRALGLTELAELIMSAAGRPAGRPAIIAIDGRGASGKSTLAAALGRAISNSMVLHTDDVAWHEPFFGWGHLLAEHILIPLYRGAAVDFRPPAWATHDRPGSITVPAGLAAVLVEGTGASQRAHAPLLDATVWVQANYDTAERRGIERDIASGVNGDAEQATRFWHEWMAHELGFLADQRPWDRAAVVVAGSPVIELGPGQWAVARPAG